MKLFGSYPNVPPIWKTVVYIFILNCNFFWDVVGSALEHEEIIFPPYETTVASVQTDTVAATEKTELGPKPEDSSFTTKIPEILKIGVRKRKPSAFVFLDTEIKSTEKPSAVGVGGIIVEDVPSSKLRNLWECGQQNKNGTGPLRLLSSNEGEALFGEFPWMVAIFMKNEGEEPEFPKSFICAGSLIHPKVILTAAHCVFRKAASELKVRLGEWDFQTYDERYPRQDRNINKVIIHEQFNPITMQNDIALVITEDQFSDAVNVGAICLPPPAKAGETTGQQCLASGWGKKFFGKKAGYHQVLRKIDLPIVSHKVCESALRGTRLGPSFNLDHSFLCAGGEHMKDMCVGDGGAPLACRIPGSSAYAQLGLVTWGIGCGQVGIPGVYTDVATFVPWIEQRLKEASIQLLHSQALQTA